MNVALLERGRQLRTWMTAIRVAARLAWRLTALLLLFVVGLLIVEIWRMLYLGRERPPLPVRVVRDWSRVLLRVIHVRVVRVDRAGGMGRDTADAPAGLLVANHISWIDIPVLASSGYRTFVAKAEVGQWPLIGAFARAAGTLFIQRGRSASARSVNDRLAQRLGDGEPVVLFPEGTTTRGHGVQRFHAFLLNPAVSAGLPVQAIRLSYPHPGGATDPRAPYVDDDTLPTHLLRVIMGGEIVCRVEYLGAYTGHHDARALAQQLHGEIASGFPTEPLQVAA